MRNNIFERCEVGLVYDAYDEVDLGTDFSEETFTAVNNLFFQSYMALYPVTGDPWTMTDNIFDNVYFEYDNNGPVAANNHNGYVNMTEQLYPTPSSTTDPALTSLTYESGPLGNFYLPSTATSLLASGSRTAAAAALYHFTSLTNNTKDAGSTVSIGAHYVALASGTPVDTDGDGIPDYLENWHGDGSYTSHTETETDWQSQYTVSGVFDPTNGVYDDIDLSGDNLVGRIKKALGRNALACQPITITPVTGSDPTYAVYDVSLNYTALANVGRIKPLLDGSPFQIYSVDANPAGNCRITWATTFMPPGAHIFNVNLSFLPPVDKDVYAMTATSGVINCPITNLLQFDPFYTEYTGDGGVLFATLRPDAATPVSYVITLYDSADPTHPVKTISNETGSGDIDESWDGSDDRTDAPYAGGSLTASFAVTPHGEPTQTFKIPYYPKSLAASDTPGFFTVAWMWPVDTSAFDTIFKIKAVWNLLNSGAEGTGVTIGPDYQSGWNTLSTAAGWGGYSGYINSDPGIGSLLTNLSESSPDTRNFYYFGHANPDMLYDTSGHYLTVEDLASITGNSIVSNGVPRGKPFRFVFLDACNTAKDTKWATAFGIRQTINSGNLAHSPQDAQAFLGWDNCFSTSITVPAYWGETLGYFFTSRLLKNG